MAIQLIKNQESGSKSKALLNDNSHTSKHPALQTSESAPTLTLPRREGKRCAFTLAEVLITLGIIGVVAALTLPTLVQNYKEKQTVTRVQKAYSIMSNAYSMAKQEHGDFANWFTEGSLSIRNEEDGTSTWNEAATNNGDKFWDIFTSYLNVASRCDSNDSSCDKYDTIYFVNGNKSNFQPSKYPTVTLNDGTTLFGGFVISTELCKGKDYICGDFGIDINGLKQGPNAIGKDIFYFFITADRISFSNKSRPFNMFCDIDKTNTIDPNGFGCTEWIMQQQNMEYLHCSPSSLTNKNKCK